MKILYVITGFGMGGAETITIDVAQKMLERGHEVAVLYLTGDNLQQHRIKLQMEIIGLHMKKSPEILGFQGSVIENIPISTKNRSIIFCEAMRINCLCRKHLSHRTSVPVCG